MDRGTSLLRPIATPALGASAAPGLPVVSEGRLAGILTRLAGGRALHEQAPGDAERRVRG